MQEDTSNPINVIRFAKRNELKDLRNRQKEHVLCHKRLKLQEVSEYVQDLTLAEFKELLLNLKKKTIALDVLRKIKNSCISYEYIKAFFKNDRAFSCLTGVLIGSDAQKQLEATACLTNLACGSHKCSYKVAKGSGAYLVSFIKGSSYFLQDQSAWAVGNIANDCSECFNIIKAQGVLPALFKALECSEPSVVQSVVFALNACTKYEDPEMISLIQSGLANKLLHLLQQENFHRCIFLDAAFTLSNCCFLIAKYSLDVFDLAAIEIIISILNKVTQSLDVDSMMPIPLVRCLGFLSYNDEVCELISVHTSFHESIQIIAVSEDCLPLKTELIWLLSNVTASSATINKKLYLSFIDCVKPILKMENTSTLQVLYYLSCLASKDASVIHLLKQHEISNQIQCLAASEKSDISQATKLFLEIIQCQ